jgi:hypothetical protein
VKKDSQTIEFRIPVKPDEERIVTTPCIIHGKFHREYFQREPASNKNTNCGTNMNMKTSSSHLPWRRLAAPGACAQPALTIYNQNFAVVRDTVPLDLEIRRQQAVIYAGATAQVEPDSVILRDPTGQTFAANPGTELPQRPVSQELLLSLFEGKTIDFENRRLKDNTQSANHSGQNHPQRLRAAGGATEQPIIEVNGKLQFSLPGEPRFPDLGDDTVLKPRSTGCCNPTSRANSTPRSATSPAALLERELQPGFAGKGRLGGFGRLDHDEQQQRQNVRERQNQIDGRRREQNPAR